MDIEADEYDHFRGRVFSHPRTGHLYEIGHIFWDLHTSQVAAYRQSIDPNLPDPDELYTYMMTGPTCLATLVDHFETKAGMTSSTIQWPQCVSEMLHLQQQDPDFEPIFNGRPNTTVPNR